VATLSTGDAVEQPVVILDVSTNGVLVEAGEALVLDAQYTLTFSAFNSHYSANLRVVREVQRGDAVLYGCRLLLPDHAAAQLSQAVGAVLGLTGTSVRDWDAVREDVERPNGEKVVVGHTPSGHPIELSPADCLEMGPEGVELFVHTVGDLERM